MKEILLILSMLLLGIFSAKAFGMTTYTPSTNDTILIQSLEEKIHTLATNNPKKLGNIQSKIPLLMNSYDENTRVGYILSEILVLIQSSQLLTEKEERSESLLRLLAEQFTE